MTVMFVVPRTDHIVHAVKRAKNPSLAGMKGIVLQETQGTFKVVTSKSQIKGASPAPLVLPLSLLTIPLQSCQSKALSSRSSSLSLRKVPRRTLAS